MDTQALRRIASQIEDTMPDSVSAGVVINAANKIDELRTELEAKDKRIAELEEALESYAAHSTEAIAALEQRIADAPHEPSCDEVRRVAGRCDCWKSSP